MPRYRVSATPVAHPQNANRLALTLAASGRNHPRERPCRFTGLITPGVSSYEVGTPGDDLAGQRPAPHPQGLRPGRRNGSLAGAVGAGLKQGHALAALPDEIDRRSGLSEVDTLGIRALNLAGDSGYSYAARTVHNGSLPLCPRPWSGAETPAGVVSLVGPTWGYPVALKLQSHSWNITRNTRGTVPGGISVPASARRAVEKCGRVGNKPASPCEPISGTLLRTDIS